MKVTMVVISNQFMKNNNGGSMVKRTIKEERKEIIKNYKPTSEQVEQNAKRMEELMKKDDFHENAIADEWCDEDSN